MVETAQNVNAFVMPVPLPTGYCREKKTDDYSNL
jgi:hypothetical protein